LQLEICLKFRIKLVRTCACVGLSVGERGGKAS
jgi:hypothetical protein